MFHKTINEDTNIKKSTKLITGPPQPPNSIDQPLQYLAAINGHSNMQLPEMNQGITSTPGTPNSTSSEDSSASSSQTLPSYDTEEETTSDDESIVSTSDRQLRTHAPISYNETVLKHLHGQPQVRTLNKVSIPLPSDSSEEDTDLETSESDEESEQFV